VPLKKPRKQQSRVSGPEHLRNVRYGRRYRQNRARVLGASRECALKLEGCTGWADQVDHVVEVDRGGPSTLDNLVPSCRTCNQKKKKLGAAAPPVAPSQAPAKFPPPDGTSCPHRHPDGSWCVGTNALGHWSQWYLGSPDAPPDDWTALADPDEPPDAATGVIV